MLIQPTFKKQSCHSCCTCAVEWNGRNADIFRFGSSRGLRLLLRESHLHGEHLSHSNGSWQNKQPRGKVQTSWTWDTIRQTFCAPPSPHHRTVPAAESEVAGSQQVCIESNAKHTRTRYRCILHFSPPIHLHLLQGIEGRFKSRGG